MSKAKRYKIKSLKNWKKEVIQAVDDFSHTFLMSPNMLYANARTAQHLGILPFVTQLSGDPITGEFIRLDTAQNFNLEVFVDDQLKDGEILLSYRISAWAA